MLLQIRQMSADIPMSVPNVQLGTHISKGWSDIPVRHCPRTRHIVDGWQPRGQTFCQSQHISYSYTCYTITVW